MSSILKQCDYRTLKLHHKIVYCDPPYANTTEYGKGSNKNEDSFNSVEFWDYMRKWSDENIVFVSEYAAPKDFVCIAKSNKQASLSVEDRGNRIEKLFVHHTYIDWLKKNKVI